MASTRFGGLEARRILSPFQQHHNQDAVRDTNSWRRTLPPARTDHHLHQLPYEARDGANQHLQLSQPALGCIIKPINALQHPPEPCGARPHHLCALPHTFYYHRINRDLLQVFVNPVCGKPVSSRGLGLMTSELRDIISSQ